MAGRKRKAEENDALAPVAKRSRLGNRGDSAEDTTPTPSLPDAASFADSVLTSRSTSRPRPKKYLCDHKGCGKAFDRPVRLEAHIRTHTNDRPFACEADGCEKSFFKAEHLKVHFRDNHSTSADHVCTYIVYANGDGQGAECGKRFTTTTRLRRHVVAHEEKEERKCEEIGCGQVFRKLETLQRHIKADHLKEKAFRCTAMLAMHCDDLPETMEVECGHTFSTISQLKAHRSREHAGPRYFCSLCPSQSPDIDHADNVNEHDISTANSSMQASGFQTYNDLQAHIRNVHPPMCTTCSRRFPSNRALTAHMDIDHQSSLADRKSKFPCDWAGCERSFTRKGNLKVHTQMFHVRSRDYVCGLFDLEGNEKVGGWDGHGCGIGFGTKANLETHVRTQHLDLPDPYHKPRRQRRVQIKNEHSLASTPSLISSNGDTPPDFFATDPALEEMNTLSLLTGENYTHSRHLPCWEVDCPFRFTRDFDLAQHMELAHAWSVDEINDRFAEESALQGEDFWIGGGGELTDDVFVVKGMYGSQAGAMLDVTRKGHVWESPGALDLRDLGQSPFLNDAGDNDSDAVMLDPALVGM